MCSPSTSAPGVLGGTRGRIAGPAASKIGQEATGRPGTPPACMAGHPCVLMLVHTVWQHITQSIHSAPTILTTRTKHSRLAMTSEILPPTPFSIVRARPPPPCQSVILAWVPPSVPIRHRNIRLEGVTIPSKMLMSRGIRGRPARAL